MYKIKGWFPNRTQMGGCGFSIVLTPTWKNAVEKSNLTQDKINCYIERMGSHFLEAHGFGKERTGDIRVSWGEWGIEHITVPGNACGLDIDESIGLREGEMALTPHNVDTIYQASLILSIFLYVADYLDLNEW